MHTLLILWIVYTKGQRNLLDTVRYVMADCRSWISQEAVHRFYMKDFFLDDFVKNLMSDLIRFIC
jgi:hypothetical protein